MKYYKLDLRSSYDEGNVLSPSASSDDMDFEEGIFKKMKKDFLEEQPPVFDSFFF